MFIPIYNEISTYRSCVIHYLLLVEKNGIYYSLVFSYRELIGTLQRYVKCQFVQQVNYYYRITMASAIRVKIYNISVLLVVVVSYSMGTLFLHLLLTICFLTWSPYIFYIEEAISPCKWHGLQWRQTGQTIGQWVEQAWIVCLAFLADIQTSSFY